MKSQEVGEVVLKVPVVFGEVKDAGEDDWRGSRQQRTQMRSIQEQQDVARLSKSHSEASRDLRRSHTREADVCKQTPLSSCQVSVRYMQSRSWSASRSRKRGPLLLRERM